MLDYSKHIALFLELAKVLRKSNRHMAVVLLFAYTNGDLASQWLTDRYLAYRPLLVSTKQWQIAILWAIIGNAGRPDIER